MTANYGTSFDFIAFLNSLECVGFFDRLRRLVFIASFDEWLSTKHGKEINKTVLLDDLCRPNLESYLYQHY